MTGRPPRRRKLDRAHLPEVMTLPEVGEALGVSPDAVRKMVKRGNLPAARLGRRLFVRRELLFRAMDGEAPSQGQGPEALGGAA